MPPSVEEKYMIVTREDVVVALSNWAISNAVTVESVDYDELMESIQDELDSGADPQLVEIINDINDSIGLEACGVVLL